MGTSEKRGEVKSEAKEKRRGVYVYGQSNCATSACQRTTHLLSPTYSLLTLHPARPPPNQQ